MKSLLLTSVLLSQSPTLDDPKPLPEQWTCYARNVLGRVFVGQGVTEPEAESKALQTCQEYSAICYSGRCQEG